MLAARLPAASCSAWPLAGWMKLSCTVALAGLAMRLARVRRTVSPRMSMALSGAAEPLTLTVKSPTSGLALAFSSSE